MIWFTIAERLSTPPQRLKQMISSSEFVKWKRYLEIEQERTTKDHCYYALIASEVRRSFVKDPIGVRLKDFILDFGKKKEREKPKTVEEAAAIAKRAFGLKP